MKKIMFSDKYGLTRAVLEGRKTQTRRLVTTKAIEKAELYREEYFNLTLDGITVEDMLIDAQNLMNVEPLCTYDVGEVVAVAQSFQKVFDTVGTMNVPQLRNIPFGHKGWNNKMFVSADLMPHHIKITNIRVERLQDISDEDCIKEGIDRYDKEWGYWQEREYSFDFYAFDSIKEAFEKLIDKVSGKGTWESNPLVFVYDFELFK